MLKPDERAAMGGWLLRRRLALGGNIAEGDDSAGSAGSPAVPDNAVFADWVESIALRGDRDAFAKLFTHYAPRVKAYLMKLGLQNAQAEELTQEVMVTVWRKAGTFDRRQASVGTWLFRIARNRRIDAFRREIRAEYDTEDPMLKPEPEPSPAEGVEAADREAAVAEALAQLPPEQMALIRRAFYEGLSHREIADATGLPLGTVKSRLRLAFDKLRSRLDGAL